MSKEIVEAVHVLEREKGISSERLMLALEDALLSAYKKQPGAAKYARVDMDRESADFKVFELLLPPELEERLLAEVEVEEPTVDPETGEMREPEDPEIDQELLAEYSEQIDERDVTPADFGRIAAQTAKQVILQRIREAERDMMFDEYQDRVGELITGIVQQSDSRYTLVQLRERVEALLPKSEQVDNERYEHGARIKAVITDVSNQAKGPSIIVSRRSPELIRKLFELEVPEIADSLVEIQNVAREPGYRSKIAVVSHASGVDPVGACVGPRGSRVRMVVSELRGEKIDIIPFNEEPARFVAKALSPARVREVLVDDEAKQATVIVPDDQLSLAIGKEGQNARLAARLTGWRVDIRSETEFAKEEAEMDYDEEEMSGRCAAILSNGKRCPNSADAGIALLRPAGPPGARRRQEGDEVAAAAGDEEPVLEEEVVVDGEHQVIQEEPHADDQNEGADDIAAEAAATEDPEYDPTQEDAASEGGVPVAEEVGAACAASPPPRRVPPTPSRRTTASRSPRSPRRRAPTRTPRTRRSPQDLGVADADGEPQGAGASEPSEAAAEESA